jgi:hypothetical protein
VRVAMTRPSEGEMAMSRMLTVPSGEYSSYSKRE